MNIVAGVCGFLLFWAAFVGYVMNIIQMFHASELTFTVAARIIGIVLFPLGCLLGFF